ncbi:MAG: alanine--tRNA ligase [Chitinophagales bacterium]|nr:alanine--tRNA ligase [Chitinophagales bacterium]
MMTSHQIRNAFLKFFEIKEHKIVPSAPLVVKNDPTLMFINSGMAPFKNIFLGNEPIKYPRVANTQKCLRVSGKHNDLEEVGVDTYHHTFFEMLGNWSFGDYFKAEAIAWSWELLTQIYKLDKDRLYVTVFEGDEKENLRFDTEAYEEWSKWIDKDRILKGNKKDNFWEMGETGPCGPCTEIHIDLRPEEERTKTDGKQLVNKGHPLVIEIWNNVFMEYERKADGSLAALPKKHVDTGMGFERLCMAVQQKNSSYDTDVFQPIIRAISNITGIDYQYSLPEQDGLGRTIAHLSTTQKRDIAIRVVADHIRTLAFTIADGQLPSNNGAGYVIRRILRRAVRYGFSYLNMEQPFIFKLVDVLAEQYKDVFPELNAQKDFVANVIKEEELSFLRTLANGLRRIDSLNKIDGKTAFELFDTYGFPFDLTKLIAAEKGWEVDEKEFEREMQAQRERARSAAVAETSDWTWINDDKPTEFVGYECTEAVATPLRYRSLRVKDKVWYQIVLDKTPFYAESGGQVGDTGYLDFDGESIRVEDTRKENELIVHWTKELPKKFSKVVVARVDKDRRNDIRKNHSATHLLQAALRKVLGPHVQQRGSLVCSEYLRFDFSHFAKMTEDEIRQTEELVNEKIQQNILLDEKRNVPIAEAERMGATMLFGEKYGENVRVITFDEEFSRELCGGTHVSSTAEIGIFKIISESAVASGIRRIEAVTGKGALSWINSELQQLQKVRELLNNPKDVVKNIQTIKSENEQLKKQVVSMEDHIVSELAKQILPNITSKEGLFFYTGTRIDVPSIDALRKLGIQLINALKTDYLLILSAIIQEKISIHLRVAPSLGLNANQLLKELAPHLRGGGPPEFVQAVAENESQVKELIDKISQKVATMAIKPA